MYKLINDFGLSFSNKLLKLSIFGLKSFIPLGIGIKISDLGWHGPILYSLNYNIYRLLDDA